MLLSHLHYLIQNIIAIHGVSDNGDDTYRVDYVNEPTPEQLAQVNTIISSWPLEKAKLEKINQLDEHWETTIQNGWITPYGWKLGLSTQDIALLNGNFTLAKEAHSMGLGDSFFIIDTDGVAYEFNLANLTMLMLQYGQARALLSAQDAAKRQAIKNASSIEELNNISII